jgi:uncharacterized protein
MKGMKRIDFEAHFYTKDYIAAMYQNKGWPRFEGDGQTKGRRLLYNPAIPQPFSNALMDELLDLGESRIAKMDECGIDVQVISLSAPGIEQLDPKIGTELARKANDDLYEATRRFPDRVMGYAALAPNDPQAAVDELQRAITELGFKGWNTHSNYGTTMLDNPKYVPILRKAEELGVPIYVHPTVPAIEEMKGYGFALAGAPFGFGIDAAVCMMRLIYSCIFDRCPRLKIILGHLGEAFPFIYQRIDWAYVRPFDDNLRPKLAKKPSEYLKNNVYVSTSGQFHLPSFMCTYETLGANRILFGSDHPYESMEEAVQYVDGLPIPDGDKSKICSLNAMNLL